MSAVLTWSAPVRSAAVPTTSATDSFTAIYNMFVAAALLSDYPWEVASSDIASASTRYVCLKRKTGAAGRIVFAFAVNSADGAWNTNIQLTVASPNNLMGCFYIAGATSDTPTNLRGGSSGAIFTGEDIPNSSPISGTAPPTTTANDYWETAANEDMIAMFNLTSTETWAESRKMFVAGLILVDPILDAERSGAYYSSSSTISPQPAISASLVGAITRSSLGAIEQWGRVVELPAAFTLSKTRDLGAKKTFFPPMRMGSYHPVLATDCLKYQMRQISYQVTPLAGREALSDGVDVFARSVGNDTSSSTIWLVNFKLY